MNRVKRNALFFLLFILCFAVFGLDGLSIDKIYAQEKCPLKFEISFPSKAHAEPITGRVYAIISKREEPELRFQTGFIGVPSSSEPPSSIMVLWIFMVSQEQ